MRASSVTASAIGDAGRTDMTVLLDARGLRTRGDRRRAPQALGQSSIYDMLSSPYYAGIVTYRGKSYPGRHEPLISQELFDRVQAVLESHNHAGERDRTHQHYLKGTIRCGTCGCRLVYSQNKGNGGTYEYFVCPYYQRDECPHVDIVESAIEEHYRGVAITEAEREEVRQAITNLCCQDIAATLDLALEILGEDLHDLYQRADDTIRRLLNQAIFKALYVCDETIANVEMTGPFAALCDFRDAIHRLPSSTPYPAPAIAASTLPNAKAPIPSRERELLDVGSISEVLVGPAGLEPATYRL
jgi:hypothetical protein